MLLPWATLFGGGGDGGRLFCDVGGGEGDFFSSQLYLVLGSPTAAAPVNKPTKC